MATMPVPEPRLQLDALTELVMELSVQHHAGDVLHVALRRCLGLTGSEFGFVGLVRTAEVDQEVDELEIVTIEGFHPAPSFYAENRVIPLRVNLFSEVVLRNRPVRTQDASQDPRRVGQPTGHPRVGSFLGVPLRLDGRPIGMIGLANRAGPYQDEHERLALTYASLVAVLIHKAQLYDALHHANAHLERLVSERTRELAQARDALAEKAARLQAVLADTVDTAERERRRIAVDIHDGITQLLIGAILELTSGEHRLAADQPDAAAQAVGRARRILGDVETEIRRVVHDLHPPVLDGLGLPAAVREVAERFTQLSRVPCDVTVSGRPVRLPPDVEIGLYRVVQEALQNVTAHAQARRVVVSLTFAHDERRLLLQVADDGRGFDPGTVEHLASWTDGRRHLGLESMRRRIESLAGDWSVASAPGDGTRVRVDVPMPVQRPVPQQVPADGRP